MGDFNAKVGKGSKGDFIDLYGLGERNERGEQLSTFAGEQGFVITNTVFALPPVRLYTWKYSGDSPGIIIRNQIDYILINQRYGNSCTSVRTYPGADISSDYNPLIGVFKIRMKTVRKKTVTKYNLEKLKEHSIRNQVEIYLSNEISALSKALSTEEKVEKLKHVVESIKNEHLKSDFTKKKTRMTEEILNIMQRRKMVKNDPIEYNNTNKAIRTKIIEAKQKDINGKCVDVEVLQLKHGSFNVH
ncbi:hypothetical protein PR048_023637 [Dryococelus australis]|uniref:Craniofacial development protein 2 n=1 Tax=Dryococelus australis TaxID=614101 RepID=A0ABQ9GUR0_9NEOP|nr:hypothetical protein PR048_023637 [Dryococelus australis]